MRSLNVKRSLFVIIMMIACTLFGGNHLLKGRLKLTESGILKGRLFTVS